MTLTTSISDRIVSIAYSYIDRSFNYEKFDCVHFVIEVFETVGIDLPILNRVGFPPMDFNLSCEEFKLMPIGHSVFVKRKASTSSRIWTHVAIIVSSHELIHCSRHFGGKVVVTSLPEFLEIYTLVLTPP
jgi:cell wall-associated NlpC family hydrolase